jgi:hypothetical protein
MGASAADIRAEEPDHRHLWLLRAHCERPRRCRAAEPSDEVAPSKANAHLPFPSPWGAIEGG